MGSNHDPRWQKLLNRRISQHFQKFHSDPTAVSEFSRRSFLQGTAAVAGTILSSPLYTPLLLADKPETTAIPTPIPGGVSPFGVLVHHFPLPGSNSTPLDQIGDPSEITDFNGFIADTHIRGAGIGNGEPLAFQTDMGAMQGEFVGTDGRLHQGTFVFV
jgi:hypothetical protein